MTATKTRTYLRISEVARELEVDRVTVWRWCKQNTIPCEKIGCRYRIDKAAFATWREQIWRNGAHVG